MINDSKLHDEDREITSETEIMNIATEVSEKDRNSEREYCLNWYTVSKMSIKDHWWWRWERPHVNDEEEIKNAEEVDMICCREIQQGWEQHDYLRKED